MYNRSVQRRDFSLTLAICGSMILHAALAETLAESYIRRAGRIWLPGNRSELAAAAPPEAEDSFRLGDSAGAGSAYDASAGDLPQIAHPSDHAQAFLGLDPPGVQSKQPPMSAMESAAAAAAPPAQAIASAAPFGLPGEASDLIPGTTQQRPADAAPAPEHPHEPSAATASPPAGIPAEQAKTESDPVSTTVDARFRPGKTEIESGRPHKITRPHLSLAAQADLMSLANPLLTLKITTDATGHVQNVAIFKSSGSGNIDEGCKLAAYDWWFEPVKDRTGKPQGDVILFNIRFI